MMSANFRIEGKVDEVIDLLTQPNIKGEKKSTFCFKFFVDISDEWDVLFVFDLLISFSISVSDAVFKENAKIASHEDCFDTWMILVFVYCG